MSEIALLLLAGVGAGLTGSIAGLASLISYPALLATGLSPVTANMTNTVALVFNSAGSSTGSRPELRGQAPRVKRLAVAAVLGGASGGGLLLLTPPGAFAKVVPWLIAGASLAVFFRRPPPVAVRAEDPRRLTAGVYLIGIYGGYFGAAAGVMMLAMLLVLTTDSLPHCNAIKNVLLGLANAVAAVGFVVFGGVHWISVPPLALGLFAGGLLGPVAVRRLPATPLRMVIALAGVGLAIRLGLQAY